MADDPDKDGAPGYRVGAVRRLTGISEHTLRAWERRHAVIEPARSAGGTRLYTEQHVARLQLLKALTDCGESIGSIARLPDERLRARLALHTGQSRPGDRPEASRLRLAMLDPDLAQRAAAHRADLGNLAVHPFDSLEALIEHVRTDPPDVMLVGLAHLEPDTLHSLARCREAADGAPVVVGYTYARAAELDALVRAGARLVRLPIRLSALRQRLSDLVTIEQARRVDGALRRAALELPGDLTRPADPRSFDDSTLARLIDVHTSIDCECPAHLSEIVQLLVAFEAYSTACLSQSARDAELHACLARATGHARATMEKMLARVCEHDGIPL